MEDQLGSFVGRLALGSVMVIMCIISVTFALKNIGGNIVYGIGAAMGMYGVVLVGKAMTQTSDANN
jgi:multidrug transporter EmrE-like cation transporter